MGPSLRAPCSPAMPLRGWRCHRIFSDGGPHLEYQRSLPPEGCISTASGFPPQGLSGVAVVTAFFPDGGPHLEYQRGLPRRVWLFTHAFPSRGDPASAIGVPSEDLGGDATSVTGSSQSGSTLGSTQRMPLAFRRRIPWGRRCECHWFSPEAFPRGQRCECHWRSAEGPLGGDTARRHCNFPMGSPLGADAVTDSHCSPRGVPSGATWSLRCPGKDSRSDQP